MSQPLLLCVIPSERVELASAITAAGGVPVIDLTCSPRVEIPKGAWVRVRDLDNAPGSGPIILAGALTREGLPQSAPKRPCWLEATSPRDLPRGYAGLVLRGSEVGGPCGAHPGLKMLGNITPGLPVILDASVLPRDIAQGAGRGVRGVVLSDVLLGLPELASPAGLLTRLQRAGPERSHVAAGARVQASALSPILRRLHAGESFWELAQGWFTAEGPAAFPAGAGGAVGVGGAAAYGSLPALLAGYHEAAAAPVSDDERDEAVAIIGVGCRFPGADSVPQFWSNILEGHSAIADVPPQRWDPALYWDPDPVTPDKTYARIGGFLTGFEFHPRRFRIPPTVARQVDPVQQITLESVADALVDAGYRPTPRDAGRDFDRTRTAVILGNSMGGEVTDDYTLRVRFPGIRASLQGVPAFGDLPGEVRDRILTSLEDNLKGDLPPITEDSMPGELSNVIAGRVANAFDLTGANFTVDAACASSMAAVQTAVKGLLDSDFDLAVSGGADRSMGVATYTKFCKIGALSPDHSAPFDASANGFVMGEGCGILLLKRLSDARRDGDRIYAVIRGIGASSDGRGKGITAPNPVGQQRALRRAYLAAGFDPVTVDLIEAHGTSTVVGDKVEVESINAVFGHRRAPERGPIRIGSVKSNIGHLKSAAGSASLIKAALAIHHGMIPPSINFHRVRPDVPLDVVPLQVQGRAEPWKSVGPRRAGVSAFGFGGTNFHVVLEQEGDAPVSPSGAALPPGIWAVSAEDRAALIGVLAAGAPGARPFEPSAPVRLVAAAADPPARTEQLERALGVLKRGRHIDVLRARGVYLEEEPSEGRIAFLFTGQGSQYLDMGLDLAKHWEVARKTFEEADRVMGPELGRPLTSYIKRDRHMSEAAQAQALQSTEISQPATLTVDVAISRLLMAHGVYPDMVAGHSLGEYAAAVAAGMLDFGDALLAVSARGREMAAVRIEDTGRMAGIATGYGAVQEVLADIPGYVVAANKNCPSQTVIAGESLAVEKAIEAFRARNVTVYPLPVSHAFHSRIVAPASRPLRRVLERLDLRAPQRPITSNVTSEYYPTGPEARRQAVDILARQVASPVEWIAQIERMYADGARIFVECGPKRALTGFVVSTLRRRPHRALYTNHPKRGGVQSIRDALSGLLALGFPVRARCDEEIPDLFVPPEPRRATPAAVAAWRARQAPPATLPPPRKRPPRQPPPEAPTTTSTAGDTQPESDLAGAVRAALRDGLGVDPAAPTVREILPAVGQLITAITRSVAGAAPGAAAPEVSVVASGASIGLPGGTEVFASDNVARILAGENRIGRLSGAAQRRFLEKNIVRLRKDARTGQGTFERVGSPDQVIRLAGRRARFDLAGDYGVDPGLLRALDITTQLAFAAGIEALRDAHIPMVRTWRSTTTGGRMPTGWALPEPLRDGTGVVFASAFPGYTKLIEHMQRRGDDGEGRFDRRFLFQILSMGHSQFAQYIGARGPNTQVNAACASTTQALIIASDWLRTGRAERVVVLGADDVTNDTMLEWIGAGFLASGAATTRDDVSRAALPFDRRRHGMILGMGAVGFVLEREELASARGIDPIARLIAGRFGNSAFHGTRLLPEHIAEEMVALVTEASRRTGRTPAELAQHALFMSHETYTPAKGGSAAAEIESLRRAFGDAASRIVIANTKGFTGHAMGAGIEDTVAVKALQYGRVPPVPNLKEPDPDLGDLRLSAGGEYPVRYAIRLAAGFGSQLALAFWEKIADGDRRVRDPRAQQRWLAEVSGLEHFHLEERQRALRLVEREQAPRQPSAPRSASQRASEPTPAPRPPASTDATAVMGTLLEIISEKTGYAPSELDADYELEADLGIDTVKQAEIFAEVRERFELPRDDDFKLADHPTIDSLAGWLKRQLSSQRPEKPPTRSEAPRPVKRPTRAPRPETVATVRAAPARTPSARGASATNGAARPASDRSSVMVVLLEIISEKTGYAPSELDADYELEADLGIDTVKQAEIFAEVRERFELPTDNDFKLADHPTIDSLAGWLTDQLVGQAAAAIEKMSFSQSSAWERRKRRTLPPVEAPVVEEPTEQTPVVEIPTAPAADHPAGLPASFRVRRPIVIPGPLQLGSSDGRLDGRRVLILGAGSLASRVGQLLTERGAELTHEAPDAVVEFSEGVREAFELARLLNEDPPWDWLCVTQSGPDPSWVGLEGCAHDGARAGLAKALGREWERCHARVIDIEPVLELDDSATRIADELSSGDAAVEIFHDEEGRNVAALSTLPFPRTGGTLSGRPLIVLTGGTRGITAKVAIEFARRGPCRLALLARTAPGADPLDEAVAKAAIRRELRLSGERVTPAAVETRLRRLRSAEEARSNIAAMRELGAEVVYFEVDTASEDAVRDVLEQIRLRMGLIDGLVHGAGLEESRLLGTKEWEDFARIYDCKATGGVALLRNLERMAWFVSMGSVAGRFGNAGQVDYSAANEAMARACQARGRALHVDWTAWADVGMAVRGGMERLLTERGVELLPADPGARLLVDMVIEKVSGEVMVAGHLGGFTLPVSHPLLDEVWFDGGAVVGRRTLSTHSDPWISDHTISGTPLLPGVIGIELMAAAAVFVRPGEPYLGARDVKFTAPIKLHRDEPVDLFVRAAALSASAVRCTLASKRRTRTGRTIEVEHFEATLLMGEAQSIPALPVTFFSEHPIGREEIYRRFFHGPVFQVLERACDVATNALLADVGPVRRLGDGLLTAPLVLEAGFQGAGLHHMATTGRMALPESVEAVEFLSQPADGVVLELMVRYQEGAYDIDIDGPEGSVLRIRGFRMVDTGPLPEGNLFPVPRGGWATAMIARARRHQPGPSRRGPSAREEDLIAARGTPRRQADRRLGRVAARTAVRELTALPDDAFDVMSHASGAPVVEGPPGVPRVSISHRDGQAVAVAVDRGRPGIDLERVEARAPAFARTWFRPREQALAGGVPERETRLWAIKEATLKALGTGMAISPRDVEVVALGRRRAAVELHDEAADRHRLLGGGALTISLSLDGELITAGAWLASGSRDEERVA